MLAAAGIANAQRYIQAQIRFENKPPVMRLMAWL